MDIKLIKDLRDKDNVDMLTLVKEKNVSVGKNGRPFMSLLLGDSSGQVDGRVWDNVESLSREIETGDVIRVRGAIQIFQGRRQMVIHRMEKADSTTINFDDFLPKSSKNADDLFAELLLIVKTMKNPQLKQLVLDSIEDPEIRPLFLRAPAAKSIHHAWVGGLLEHVLSILKTMEFMASHYSFLNRDLLIFGAIFHDLGKIWELSWEQGISYTFRGRLIGHMEMACELIDRKSSKILGFDPELRDVCKHIVLSHHGKLEYGSSKRPKFLEAMIVAMVDDLDSKMSTVKTLIDNERGGTERWSRYSDLFDRYFLLDDLKETLE